MEVKTHYKMYKAGKKWMFAAITAISLGAGLGIGTYTAQASSVNSVLKPATTTATGKTEPTTATGKTEPTTATSKTEPTTAISSITSMKGKANTVSSIRIES